MSKIETVEEFQKIWKDEGLPNAMRKSDMFFRMAVQSRREDVKMLLVEIANGGFGRSSKDAIDWLEHYKTLSLVPLFLKLLNDENLQDKIVKVFSSWSYDGLIPIGDETLITALTSILKQVNPNTPEDPLNPIPYEDIFQTLSNLRAVTTIDLITLFLEHPRTSVRSSVIRCLITLSKFAKRNDIVEKLILFLRDPEREIRLVTAFWLKEKYPEKVANIIFTDDPIDILSKGN